jgi:hypothetical protein
MQVDWIVTLMLHQREKVFKKNATFKLARQRQQQLLKEGKKEEKKEEDRTESSELRKEKGFHVQYVEKSFPVKTMSATIKSLFTQKRLSSVTIVSNHLGETVI